MSDIQCDSSTFLVGSWWSLRVQDRLALTKWRNEGRSQLEAWQAEHELLCARWYAIELRCNLALSRLVEWHPTNKELICSAPTNGAICLWNCETKGKKLSMQMSLSWLHCFSFSSTCIARAHEDSQQGELALRGSHVLHRLTGHAHQDVGHEVRLTDYFGNREIIAFRFECLRVELMSYVFSHSVGTWTDRWPRWWTRRMMARCASWNAITPTPIALSHRSTTE